jgi:pimeloyl-ACP methyl ester carboxylesterase
VLGDLAALKERPDSTSTLAQIDLPTLLLPGAEDLIVPLHEAQAMHAAIRGSRLAVIPDAGHLPNLENPSAFNQAIRDFLATIRANAPA